jgi:hypothetical protein
VDTTTGAVTRFVTKDMLIATSEGDMPFGDFLTRHNALGAGYANRGETNKKLLAQLNVVIAERDALKAAKIGLERRILELKQPVAPPAVLIPSLAEKAADPVMVGGWLAIQDADLPAGEIKVVPAESPEAKSTYQPRWRRFTASKVCASCGIQVMGAAQVRKALDVPKGTPVDGEPVYQPRSSFESAVCMICAVKSFGQAGVPAEWADQANMILKFKADNANNLNGPVRVVKPEVIAASAPPVTAATLTNSPVAADRVQRIKAIMAQGLTLAEAMEIVKAGLDA